MDEGMHSYKSGDFAKVQGQLVEIIDVRVDGNTINYRVRLAKFKNKLTSWINSLHLEPISSQRAPKVLYGTKPK